MMYYCLGMLAYLMWSVTKIEKGNAGGDVYIFALVFASVIWPFSIIFDAIPPREY